MATQYFYDTTYKLYAYRDMNLNLVVTQGEGYVDELTADDLVKAPRFQLVDERGEIIPPDSAILQLAIKRPNGTESLVSCIIEQDNGANTSYFKIPIHKSITDYAGDVHGEVRLIADEAIIKFYGVNFYVYDGVSDEAAEQSEPFSDLIRQLQKVVAVTPAGTIDTASLDTEIEHTGTNPVASGVIYDYIHDTENPVISESTQLGDGVVHEDSINDESVTPAKLDRTYTEFKSIQPNEIDSAIKNGVIYRVILDYMYNYVFCVKDNSGNLTQYRFSSNGDLKYRSKSASGTWDSSWYPIGSRENIADNAINSGKLAPSAVVEDAIDTDAVTTTKIKDRNVTSAKIGTGEVKTANIDSGAVTSAKIGTGEVKTANIDSGAVTTTKIKDRNVTSAKLDRTYTEFKSIQPNEINSAKTEGIIYKVVLDNAYNYIFCVKEDNGGLTQYRFSSNGYVKYRTGTTAGTSWSSWIAICSTQNIENYAITANKIDTDAVTSAKIGDGEVKTANIDTGAVTSAKIGTGEVKTANIDSGAVTPEKLSQAYQDEISTDRPLAFLLASDNVPYSVGKLFYYKDSLYRYTGYHTMDAGAIKVFDYDVTRTIHTGTTAPKSSETVTNLGVGSYAQGDMYVRRRGTDTKIYGIYVCGKVQYTAASTPITSTTSLQYTYEWEEIPVKSDVYTKEEIDDILGVGRLNDDVLGLQVDLENKVFTRLASAVGKNAGSDFDSFPMYGDRKRCNVADDGTINAYYGDADYADDGSNGQVMVYQPAFWYKVVPVKLEKNSNGVGYHIRKANYYVSSVPKSGFKLHPLFYDENGNAIDYVLLSAYEGSYYDVSASDYVNDETGTDASVDTGDLLCSVSNRKPISGKTKLMSRANLELIASNRGMGWHLDTIKSVAANQLLMMIEFGQLNIQSTSLGLTGLRGIVDIPLTSGDSSNFSCISGSTVSSGNSTGFASSTTCDHGGEQTTYSTNGMVAISYRGQENPWGNIFKHVNGMNLYGDGSMGGGQLFICDDFNYAENKHTDNYKPSGFSIANTNGYASAFGYGDEDYDWLIVASESSGTSALPAGDYIRTITGLNGYRGVIYGGDWDEGDKAGLFYTLCSLGLSAPFKSYIGGRLLYVPTAFE